MSEPLRVVVDAPDVDVVATCEEILQRAKAGEIVSIAVAIEMPQRGMATQYKIGAGGEHFRLAGAVSHLLHRLNVKIEAM